jgi:hypothetical protein
MNTRNRLEENGIRGMKARVSGGECKDVMKCETILIER